MAERSNAFRHCNQAGTSEREMFYTYILQSINFGKYYIGQTLDVNLRLIRHNKGGSRWTNKFKPWKLVYFEEFETRAEAVRWERYLKSLKDKSIIKKLVSRGGRAVKCTRL